MKKIITLFITIIASLIILISISYAAEGQNMSVSLSTNKNSYNVGEEILVYISVDEIKGFSGLNTFTARKVYDKEILEYIGAEVTNENWKVLGDAENILLRKMEGEDLKRGKICTLKFKAKQEGIYKIQIDNIDACNNNGDVYYEDENVNSPIIEISIKNKGNNNTKEHKSYLGIILIVTGTIGLIGVVIHYTINKNKF